MVKFFLFFVQVIFVSNAVPLTSRYSGKETSFSYIGSYKEQSNNKARSFNEADYFVSANSASWPSSLADCKRVFGSSANIVTIETVGEWEFLKEHLENYSGTRYWTSGMFDPSSQVWRWTPNKLALPQSAPWTRGLIKSPTSIHRVLIYRVNQFDASWSTEAYTRMERFICEVPAGQTLTGLYSNDVAEDKTDDVGTPNAPCDYFKEGMWV